MNCIITITTETGVKFDAVVYLDDTEIKSLNSFNTLGLDWVDFKKDSIIRKYKIEKIDIQRVYSDIVFWCNDDIVKDILNNLANLKK